MKRFPLSKKTLVLFVAAGLLLTSGTVGSTRAALTAQSEVYEAALKLSEIDVQLLENGEVVAEGEGFSSALETGKLLEKMTEKKDDGTFKNYIPGKAYDEAISITNNGQIVTFYRVILTKRWEDADGKAATDLDPSFIDLNLVEGSGWIVDESATTPERMILYYTKALAPGESSTALSDTLTVDSKITKIATKSESGGKVTIEYKYNNKYISLAAEVDGVQSGHGEEAMLSAWGINASVSGDTMSLR